MALDGFLGRKIGMTQVTRDGSGMTPVTVIATPPNVVTQVRTLEKDGYTAVQLGAFPKKRATRAVLGHAKKAGAENPFTYLREIRCTPDEISVGQSVSIEDIVDPGDWVHVTGISIGKGTAGTVKRHHFGRGPMAHGSKFHRLPGSSGSGTTPGRVVPGSRRAGHLGAARSTAQNLEVVEVNGGDGYILLKGSVPGPDKGLVILHRSPASPTPEERKARKERQQKEVEEKRKREEEERQKQKEEKEKVEERVAAKSSATEEKK